MRYNVFQLRKKSTPDGERVFASKRGGPFTLEECCELAAELDDRGCVVYIWPEQGAVAVDRPVDGSAPSGEEPPDSGEIHTGSINAERYGGDL